jgi:hypothetical protein
MLCVILIVGGLLIMMGQHDRSEALFYYFRREDQVPETHLLRLIEKHISFAFVRERLKQSYSETGRPSKGFQGVAKHDPTVTPALGIAWLFECINVLDCRCG